MKTLEELAAEIMNQAVPPVDKRADLVHRILKAPDCATSKRELLGLPTCRRRRPSAGVSLFPDQKKLL
jgi:hypothetical protein